MKSTFRSSLVFALTLAFLLQPISASAVISNGANAIDLIGQYADYTNTTVLYEKTLAYNSPNEISLNTPWGIAMDTIGHRLFVGDRNSHRVLVFNLNSSNQLVDKVADNVLGQANFLTVTAADTQSGLNFPNGIAYDSVNSRLFVTEGSGNRVKVFDVATITNGEPAVNVIGQPDFTSAIATSTQTGLNLPYDVAYDASSTRLFVAERTGSRVKIFDVATITDGEPAINVLGQTTFTGSNVANTQIGLSSPQGLAYDPINSRLFVSENANRVKVFDVATTSNGKPAAFVLGQSTFTGASASSSPAGLNTPQSMAYDAINSRLYVGEPGTLGNRVKVFDVTTITNGESPINVLGQPDYTTTTATNSQSGLNNPYGLLIDPTNSLLYTVERAANRIKIFDVAAISDGENAVNLLGQYTDSFNFIPSYTKSATYNSPNEIGFSLPTYMVTDKINHRLFVSDRSVNGRVLIYNLNPENVLVDKAPDFILGQADFNTDTTGDTASTLRTPRGLAYDQVNNRLFVAENSGHRVKVFDVNSITNGESAIHILGQSDFIASSSANTQSGLSAPQDLDYDAVNSRLFVAEQGGSRIKVFDVASITDGEPAINILGQIDFSSSAPADTQTGLTDPRGMLYEPISSRLFVAEGFNANRVKIFDVASITDGEPAVNILGQSDFTSTAVNDTQSGFNIPRDMAYDPINSRLFVVENIGNRVKVFDISTITDGEPAINVLGQSNYTSSAVSNAQPGLNTPFGILYNEINGNLYVSETGANRIKIFDASVAVVAPQVTPPSPSVVNSPSGGGFTSGSPIFATPVVATDVGCANSALYSSQTGKKCIDSNNFSTPVVTISYKRDLTTGATGLDVKQLQQFLNAKGFIVAISGAGSKGNETEYFGTATRAALVKFQKASKITPAVGYFGPVTRAFISKTN